MFYTFDLFSFFEKYFHNNLTSKFLQPLFTLKTLGETFQSACSVDFRRQEVEVGTERIMDCSSL